MDMQKIQAALRQARKNGDTGTQISCHIAIGSRMLAERKVARARWHLSNALNLAQEHKNREDEGVALHGLGASLMLGGDAKQAAEYLDRAFAIAHELGDTKSEFTILSTRSKLHGEAPPIPEMAKRRLDHLFSEYCGAPQDPNALLRRYIQKEQLRPTGTRFLSPRPIAAWRCLLCPVDIFISYRHSDGELFSRRLSEALRKIGLRVTFAPDIGIRPRTESESENEYDFYLMDALGPYLDSARIFLMIGGGSYLDTYWTKWESDRFEEGPGGNAREGKMLSIIGSQPTEMERTMFWLKAVTDGIPIRETRSGWLRNEPSGLVVGALAYHVKRFRRELLAQLVLWLLPPFFRRRLFCKPADLHPADFESYSRIEGEAPISPSR